MRHIKYCSFFYYMHKMKALHLFLITELHTTNEYVLSQQFLLCYTCALCSSDCSGVCLSPPIHLKD